MDEQEITPDIRELNYGSILFRHIDRILSLSNKDYPNKETKLFTFAWAVRLLKSTISSEIAKDLPDISGDGTYADQFTSIEKAYSACVDLLSKKGYLYKKVTDGVYEQDGEY